MSHHHHEETTASENLLLPLRAVELTFRFTRATRTGPYHYAALAGFIKQHLGGSLPPTVWLAAPDNGIPAFERGDTYHLVLFALSAGLETLDQLFQVLPREAPPAPDDGRAFGPRWRFEEAADLFADEGGRNVVSRAADLEPFTRKQLEDRTQAWTSVDSPRLRFISPVQILREKQHRSRKGPGRFCHDAAHVDGPLLLERLRQSLGSFVRRLADGQHPPAPDASLALTDADLFWHGGLQVAADGGEKPLYGLNGVANIRVNGPETKTVWRWLVVGQYLGMGQRRGFGLGRYRLETAEAAERHGFPRRRSSLLGSAMAPSNLETEPPREFRRPVSLSQTPMVDSSNC